jgi:hypothetical protein
MKVINNFTNIFCPSTIVKAIGLPEKNTKSCVNIASRTVPASDISKIILGARGYTT